MTPERKLWLNVIYRALREAEGGFVYGDNARTIKYRARKWLTHPTHDIFKVAEYAGATPEQIQEIIKESQKKYGKRC